jgi:hypothetical protein
MSDAEITHSDVADTGLTDRVLVALTWLEFPERDELIRATEAAANTLARIAELLDLADWRASARSVPNRTG